MMLKYYLHDHGQAAQDLFQRAMTKFELLLEQLQTQSAVLRSLKTEQSHNWQTLTTMPESEKAKRTVQHILLVYSFVKVVKLTRFRKKKQLAIVL